MRPSTAIPLLLIVAAACQRRDELDLRTPLDLGASADWQFVTTPDLPLTAAELETIARKAVESTGRFAVPAADRAEEAAVAARLRVRFSEVEVVTEPATEVSEATFVVSTELRVEYRPPLAEPSQVVVVLPRGGGRGGFADASRHAFETALGRGLDEIAAITQGRTKSDEELAQDVSGADALRAATALDLLAARRHPAAFTPLIQRLHGAEAAQALGLLVALGDPRAVRPIVEAAEHRDLAFLIQAAYALGSLGGEDAEAYLFTLETGHADARVRLAAHDALAAARRATATRRASHAPAPEPLHP